MSESGLVERLDGIGYILEVVTVARFVTKRPDEDANMVAHPLHVVLRTFHHSRTERLHRRKFLVCMALHIGFSQHIETILVAKVVEHRIVRIVRSAHRIDVQPLHRLDVLFYLFCRDGTAVDRTEVVTVHAMEDHTLTVDDEGAISTNAHLTETHFATTDVDNLTFFVLQCQYQVIEVRCFGTPFLGVRHVHVEAQFSERSRGRGTLNMGRSLGDDRASIHDFSLDLPLTCYQMGVFDPHFHICLGIHIVSIQVGGEEIVTNLALRG